MMSPAGGRHGRIAGKLFLRIGNIVEQHDLGQTFAAETGFLLARHPDTVRAPDVSFVSYSRLGEFTDCAGYLPLAPDLVAEVVSPNDTSSDVEAKAEEWLNAGSKIVLVADPSNQTLRVYKSKAHIEVLHSGEEFSSGDVCGDWKISVNEIFDIQD